MRRDGRSENGEYETAVSLRIVLESLSWLG
jgi:hypothetical protein